MAEIRSPLTGEASLPGSVIERGLFRAEYSMGQRKSGQWVALGTVRGDASDCPEHPALIIVGTGVSSEESVAQLTSELERFAATATGVS